MKISDKGIILSQKRYQEGLLLLKILSQNNGLCSGIVKKPSKKRIYDYQVGTLVAFERYSRLSEQLGTLACEKIKSYQGNIISSKSNLYLFRNIANLVLTSFIDHEPHIKSFTCVANFLDSLSNFSWLKYCYYELEILEDAGYGLELDECVVTNSRDNLKYVSPKSGKAVSLLAAKGYENLLLKLPDFLTHNTEPTSKQEILEALDLSEYFFKRYIWGNKQNNEVMSDRNILREIIHSSNFQI